MTTSTQTQDSAPALPLAFDFRDTGRLRTYIKLLLKLCRARRLPDAFEDVVDDAQRCLDWRIDDAPDPVEIAARLQHLADCVIAHWCLGKSASGLTDNQLRVLSDGFRSLSVALILHNTRVPAFYYVRPGEAWWLPEHVAEVGWPDDDDVFQGDID